MVARSLKLNQLSRNTDNSRNLVIKEEKKKRSFIISKWHGFTFLGHIRFLKKQLDILFRIVNFILPFQLLGKLISSSSLHIPSTTRDLSLLCAVLTSFFMLLSKSDSVCEQRGIFIGILRNLHQYCSSPALSTVHSEFTFETSLARLSQLSI